MKDRVLRITALFLYSGVLSYGVYRTGNLWILLGLIIVLIIGESKT